MWMWVLLRFIIVLPKCVLEVPVSLLVLSKADYWRGKIETECVGRCCFWDAGGVRPSSLKYILAHLDVVVVARRI